MGYFFKCVTIVNASQKVWNDSTGSRSVRKPNKIWVDKGSEFYNSFFKKLLNDNDIEMYSIHNEGKFCCYWKIYYNFTN